MKFRNSKYGIIIRRNLSKWFFWPIYYLQKIYLNTKLFIYKDKPMIIILTIGKVASSSLYFTLKDNLNSNIFHLHFISNSGIKKSWISHLSSKRKSIPLHLINSKILEKKIGKHKGHLNIITIFREPVERKISAFFQNIDQYYNQIDNKELKIEDKLNDNFFMEHFNEEDNWIYEELIKKFGFKVYKKNEFNEKGFIIERLKNRSLLIFKTETLNKNFKTGLEEFFDFKISFNLKKYNKGKEKYYSSIYKKFKSNFRLNNKTLRKIQTTNFYKTFYES